MLAVGGGENRAALPGLNSLAQQARGAKMRLDLNAGKLMKTRQQQDKGAFQAPRRQQNDTRCHGSLAQVRKWRLG
ncbi:hypothetical protein RTE01_43410 [Raoultella terrigena]|nr:hypothetical protein RTE01_43410 [Raoultella terrigena]